MECEKSGIFEKYLNSTILWNFPHFHLCQFGKFSHVHDYLEDFES